MWEYSTLSADRKCCFWGIKHTWSLACLQVPGVSGNTDEVSLTTTNHVQRRHHRHWCLNMQSQHPVWWSHTTLSAIKPPLWASCAHRVIYTVVIIQINPLYTLTRHFIRNTVHMHLFMQISSRPIRGWQHCAQNQAGQELMFASNDLSGKRWLFCDCGKAAGDKWACLSFTGTKKNTGWTEMFMSMLKRSEQYDLSTWSQEATETAADTDSSRRLGKWWVRTWTARIQVWVLF